MRFKNLIKEIQESRLYKDLSDKFEDLTNANIHMNIISKVIHMSECDKRANLGLLEYKIAKYSYLPDSFDVWYGEHILNTREDLIVDVLLRFIYLFNMSHDLIGHSGNMSTYFNAKNISAGTIFTFIRVYSSIDGPKPFDTKTHKIIYIKFISWVIFTYSNFEIIESIIKHKIKYYG